MESNIQVSLALSIHYMQKKSVSKEQVNSVCAMETFDTKTYRDLSTKWHNLDVIVKE